MMKYSVTFPDQPERTVYGYRRKSDGTVYWRRPSGRVHAFSPVSGWAGDAAEQSWETYGGLFVNTYEPIYEPFTITIGA